jgi:excisionase family DNA binding protein
MSQNIWTNGAMPSAMAGTPDIFQWRVKMDTKRMKDENADCLSVSVNRAAVMVGVSRRFLYDEIKLGRLRSGKAGRRRLIEVVDLRAWLRARVDEHMNKSNAT